MKLKLRKYAGPLCSLILFTGALWILGHEVRAIHLQHISFEIKAIPGKRFGLAVALTALSYALMTGYDFLAIRFIKHSLSAGKIALASFLGYAFSNNIGLSMLAGASVRYRLYSGWGLSALEITKVVSFGTVSLWLGFFGLGGAVFVWEPLAIPPGWHVPFATVQPIGVMLLSFLAAYLALAAATVMLSAQELFRRDSRLVLCMDFLKRRAPSVLPSFLSFNAFIGGAILLFSGATPALEARLGWLSRLLPLPLLELSHFLGSIAGVALLVLARGFNAGLTPLII